MQDVVIVVRNAGHALPADVLTPILEKHNRYVGFAFADGESVKVVRRVKSDKWTPSLESIQGGDVRFKDKKVIYCFGSVSDDAINNIDIQPYEIFSNDKNQPQLVAFLDGDFSGFMTEGTPNHGQTLAIQKEISPRLVKAFRLAGGDLEKLMEEELTDPMMGRDLVNTMVGEKGCILLLSANDVDLHYSVKGDSSTKKYDWGWVSNTSFLKQEEPADPFQAALAKASSTTETKPAKEQAPVQTAVKGLGFRRPSATDQAKVVASPNPVTGKPKEPAPAATPLPNEVKETEEEYIEISVPKNCLKDAKAKSNFLRKRIPGGILPPDWYNTLNTFTLKMSQITEQTKKDLERGANNNYRIFKKSSNGMTTVKSFQDMEVASKKQDEKPADSKSTEVKPEVTVNTTKTGGFRRPGQTPKEAVTTAEHNKNVKPLKDTNKDTATHHIGENDKKGVVEGIYLIPPVQREEMINYMNTPQFKETLDRNSALIGNPDKFREAEVPSFAKQLNHPMIKDIIDTHNWPNEIKLAMIKNEPDVALACLNDWISLASRLKVSENELRTKLNELEAAASPNQSQQTEQPAKVSGGFKRPGRAA